MNKGQIESFLSDVDTTDLSPIQKQKIRELLHRHQKPAEKKHKIRTVKSKDLYSLQEWEERIGRLDPRMMMRWIDQHQLCPKLIADLVEEFRMEMVSKGKKYANFKATFQVYLLKGYLSKKMGQVLLANSPHKGNSATQIFSRGVSI